MLTRALALVLLSAFSTVTSFYLLLSVVPLYATSLGANGIGAGLATGALMFATVGAELVTPRLVGAFGYRLVFAGGVLLLGVPALAFPGATTLQAILAICVVRGLGFAITVVVGGSLVASLVPAERRGEGLGLLGVVVGVPAIVALPLGVWLAGHVGYVPVFIAGAVTALIGLVSVPVLPGRAPKDEATMGMLAGLRNTALVRPSIVFAATATAAGVIFTFVPLAITHASGNLAALALFAQAVTATASRWWAGHHGDRHGSGRLLIPSVVASAAGLLALVLIDSPVAIILGMLVFGAGFGVAQNASLSLMFERVSPAGYDTVSAIWNLAYDAGLGIGGVAFGVLAAKAGYPSAFAITAVLMLVVLGPAWRDRAASRYHLSMDPPP